MGVVVLDSIRNQNENALREQFAIDVLKGLSSKPKSIPAKYFYDSDGSKIYERITDLDEYYLTGCEFDIFNGQKKRIAKAFNQGRFNLIELGAGDGRKTKVLLQHFIDQGMDFRYIPIDISEAAMNGLVCALRREMPSLQVDAVVGEYLEAFKFVRKDYTGLNIVLFLGSNIGNFHREDALGFLSGIWHHLNANDLMFIGLDLKKSVDVMTKAYDDPQEVTAEFNYNLLKRINRELGGEFHVENFMHHGVYNPVLGAMESYLISTTKQSVFIKEIEKEFQFEAFEPIHVEYSFKYSMQDIERLANKAGFAVIDQFFDSKKYFVDSLWKVKKAPGN